MNTDKYHGLLGIKGHRSDLEILEQEYFGPLGKTNYIVEADVVGGAWIVETDWVRLAFRTRHWTWGTGEDYTWCANLRKFANIPCFVLPHDQRKPDTWGVSKDYFAISEKGDTTDDSKLILRRDLAHHLWQRGEPLMHVVKDVWDPKNILFVVTAISQVTQIVTFIQTRKIAPEVIFFVYAGESSGDGQIISQLELKTTSVMKDGNGCCRGIKLRLFDLGLGRDFSRRTRSIDNLTEVLYGIDQAN